MSAAKDSTSPNSAFLAPEPLSSIALGQDLLVKAGCCCVLGDLLEPESPAYERATQELAKVLVLARVAIADALSHLEDES